MVHVISVMWLLLKGIAWGLIGPTLLDLEILTQSSTDTISMTFMGRAVGGLGGAVTAGKEPHDGGTGIKLS